MVFEGAPHGIQVNAVSPGPLETDQRKKKHLLSAIPLGRLVRPEEVASAVAFLTSNRASYITAKVLDVNGGVLMDYG